MRIDRGRREREEVRRTVPAWDNSGLRHRVEGRAVGGVDIADLQVSVVARTADNRRHGRRRRLRR
ncbi:MAG: hypothetical protein ACRDGK_01560 [Actinomycetota bacterium]